MVLKTLQVVLNGLEKLHNAMGYGIGANLAYLAVLWLDIESSVCYEFLGDDFFQENNTFIRKPMLIHLSRKIYKVIKDKNKIDFIENVKNVKLEVYDTESNFHRLGDKNMMKNIFFYYLIKLH